MAASARVRSFDIRSAPSASARARAVEPFEMAFASSTDKARYIYPRFAVDEGRLDALWYQKSRMDPSFDRALSSQAPAGAAGASPARSIDALVGKMVEADEWLKKPALKAKAKQWLGFWGDKFLMDRATAEEEVAKEAAVAFRDRTCYEKIRREHCPSPTHKQKRGVGNRAGNKFMEMCAATGMLDGIPLDGDGALSFVDICGGPGAWTKVVLEERQGARGWGLSLREGTIKSCVWYKELQEEDRFAGRFTTVWGPAETGDVFQDAAALCNEIGAHVHFVMADGGDGIGFEGHRENYAELLAASLVCAELRVGLRVLRPGGALCVKVFDTFSALMASVLWGLRQLFAEVKIVKPVRSRALNSERYVVAMGFREDADFLSAFLKRLDSAAGEKEERSAVSLFPLECFRDDEAFCSSLRESAISLCDAQTESLRQVVNAFRAERPGARVLADAPLVAAKRAKCG